MSDTEKMFTFAALTNHPGRGDSGVLVFNGSGPLSSEEELQAIATAPGYKRLFDGVTTVIYPNKTGDLTIASPELDEGVFSKMEKSTPSDTALFVSSEGKIERVNLYETYYGCTLPHKLILGCSDCLYAGPNPRDCRVKELALDNDGGRCTPPTLEELQQYLKSRRDKIADFLFVGPRLTTMADFAPAFRSVEEHDFGAVDTKSRYAKVAAVERERRRRFEREDCTRCMVQRECEEHRPKHERNRCYGPYATTEEEAARTILGQVAIPYTAGELTRCLNACGGLRKRFKKRIHYATFAMEGQILTFGFRGLHHPHSFTPILPGHKFNDTLSDYCGTSRNVGEKLTLQQKALLCELAVHDTSPTIGHGWHRTSYRAVHIERPSPSGELLQLHFKYNSGRRGLLPWKLRVRSLADLFGNYGHFSFLSNERAPNARYSSRYRY